MSDTATLDATGLALPSPPEPASGTRHALTMIGRSVRLSRRQVDALLMSLMLPIMLMLVFVYLFGGAINTGTKYVTYVVPGVILLCAGFGAAMTAVSVAQDMRGGIIDRFRSMDLGGSSILTGHVTASVARNIVSSVLVLGVAFLIGFRPKAGLAQWLAAVGILLMYIIAISWLSAAVGLLAKTPDAASGYTFLVMFLPYASSAFVPINTMPSWIHGFARDQPVTPVTETIRGLLLDSPVGTSPWRAIAWCAGLIVASAALAAVLFRRRTG